MDQDEDPWPDMECFESAMTTGVQPVSFVHDN